MKALNLTLLFVLSAGTVAAQSPWSAAGVEVLSSRWRHLAAPNPTLDQDPLAVNERQANLQKGIIQAISANQARVKADQPPVQIPTVGTSSTTSVPRRTRPSASYSYEIRVRNTGTKTIRRLVWNYALSDPTDKSVRSRPYENKTKIRPGGIKSLFAKGGPPRGVVNVNQGSQLPADNSPEQVIIERVEYTDGSVWTRPPD